MSKVYFVVRGKIKNEEFCDVYTMKCNFNELNVLKIIFKNYEEIIQFFIYTSKKEADNICRQIREVI